MHSKANKTRDVQPEGDQISQTHTLSRMLELRHTKQTQSRLAKDSIMPDKLVSRAMNNQYGDVDIGGCYALCYNFL